jgi:dTDP-4-dehydrorhamnose 3,5-epimerase-like enzyme
MSTTIHDCNVIQLPRIYDRRGSLTAIYSEIHVPFDIVRTYYLYDVPGGEDRGGHAHKELQQLIVAVMGAFEVLLDDGQEKKKVRLDRAYNGLYVPKQIWREITNFSSGANCLVLASLFYDENEYIRSYDEFIKLKTNENLVS